MEGKTVIILDIDEGLKVVTYGQEPEMYENIQKVVGGRFESIPPINFKKKFRDYYFFVNEGGRMLKLPKNELIDSYLEPDCETFYVGNVFILKSDENGDTISLTKEDIELFKKTL